MKKSGWALDFSYSPEQITLRDEVREYLERNASDEVKNELVQEQYYRRYGPKTREFFAQLRDRGWLSISWPREWGGQGGSRIDQFVVEEELCRAGYHEVRGGGGVPTILAVGTDAQKEEFVRPALSDDVHFALGYTEPDAGADLAGLKCRAIRDGDEFVINGQKLYTSAVHDATHIYLMARTDPDAERHAGISILLVPIETPGITVRPLWTIQNDPPAPPKTTYGNARTNEVFFENVRVPSSCLLGEENGGWKVGSAGLNLDRVGANRYLMSVHLTEDIINWIKTDEVIGPKLRKDPVVRDTLAELWVEAQVCRLMTMRSMSIIEHGGNFTYEGSAEKVWAPEHGVRATEAVAQILGPYAQLLNGSEDAIESGLYAHNLLGAYQSGVNHGSVQVMRDQVARRGLELKPSR